MDSAQLASIDRTLAGLGVGEDQIENVRARAQREALSIADVDSVLDTLFDGAPPAAQLEEFDASLLDADDSEPDEVDEAAIAAALDSLPPEAAYAPEEILVSRSSLPPRVVIQEAPESVKPQPYHFAPSFMGDSSALDQEIHAAISEEPGAYRESENARARSEEPGAYGDLGVQSGATYEGFGGSTALGYAPQEPAIVVAQNTYDGFGGNTALGYEPVPPPLAEGVIVSSVPPRPLSVLDDAQVVVSSAPPRPLSMLSDDATGSSLPPRARPISEAPPAPLDVFSSPEFGGVFDDHPPELEGMPAEVSDDLEAITGMHAAFSPQVQTGEQDAEFGPGPQTAEHTDFAPALEEIEGFLDDVLNEDDFASEGAAPEESTQMTSLNELKRARDSEADLAAAIMASDESEMEMVIEEDGSVTVTGAAELPADRPNEDLADFDFDVEMATSPGLDGASALDFDDATNIGFAPESDPEPELAPPPSASTRPSAAPPPEDQDTAQRPSFFKKLFNR